MVEGIRYRPRLILVGALLFMATGAAALVRTERLPRGLVNGDCEAAKVEGWFSSGWARSRYEIVLDRQTVHGGEQSCHYRPKVRRPERYGTIMQEFAAEGYRGRRVRASVWVKTVGVTGRGDFWVRAQAVDSPGDGPGLGGGWRKLAPDSDWARYDIAFTVDPEAHAIDFGVGIDGPGKLWIDDATFEVAGEP